MTSVLEKQYGKYSLQEIRNAKAEFYIKSDNTGWGTIESKYRSMIKKASQYKRPKLERSYKILQDHYEGFDRIGKEEREGLRGHPKQKKAFPAERNTQKNILTGIASRAKTAWREHEIKKQYQAKRKESMGVLSGLARKAKTQQLQDWRKIYQPAGRSGVVEYKVPYEPRFYQFYDKKRDAAEKRNESQMDYYKSKIAAGEKARAERGLTTRQDYWDRYANPANPKRKTKKGPGWRKPRTPTAAKIKKKYDTTNRKGKQVKFKLKP